MPNPFRKLFRKEKEEEKIVTTEEVIEKITKQTQQVTYRGHKNSAEFVAVEEALDELNSLEDSDISIEGLDAIIKAQKKLAKVAQKYMEKTAGAVSIMGMERYDMVKTLYEMTQREDFRDVNITDAIRKGQTWKDVRKEARKQHIDLSGKMYITVGDQASGQLSIPTADGSTGYFKRDAVYVGYRRDASQMVDSVVGALKGKYGSVSETIESRKEAISSVWKDNCRDKDPIHFINEYYRISGEKRSKEVTEGLGQFFYTAKNSMSLDLAPEAKIDSGADLTGRNVAASRIADLMGHPGLVAKSQVASIDIFDEEVKGTLTTPPMGKDCRSMDLTDILDFQDATDFSDPAFQVQVSALHAFDYLTGQVGRNTGNMFYTTVRDSKHAPQKMVAIQGVDSGASFGRIMPEDLDATEEEIRTGYKKTPFPYAIDKSTADSILAMSDESLSFMSDDVLNEYEISALKLRLHRLQNAIEYGEIKVVEAKDWAAQVGPEFEEKESYIHDIKAEQLSPQIGDEQKELLAKAREVRMSGKETYIAAYERLMTVVDKREKSPEYTAVCEALGAYIKTMDEKVTTHGVTDFMAARQKVLDACLEYERAMTPEPRKGGSERLSLVGGLIHLTESENISDECIINAATAGKTYAQLLDEARTMIFDMTGVAEASREFVGSAMSKREILKTPEGKKLFFTPKSVTYATDTESIKAKFFDAISEDDKTFVQKESIFDILRTYGDIFNMTVGNTEKELWDQTLYTVGECVSRSARATMEALKDEDKDRIQKLGVQLGRIINAANKFADARIEIGRDMSDRNVATSRLATLFGCEDLVAKSYKASVKDAQGVTEGVVMEGAVGIDARGKDPEQALKLLDVKSVVEKDASGKTTYSFDAFDDPRFQKQITSMQVFDFIGGQIDRHPGNMFYQVSDPDEHGNRKLLGIQGIDNDLAFGLLQSKTGVGKSGTLDQIKFIDARIANNILGLNREVIESTFCDVLSDKERMAVLERVTAVQDIIKNGEVKIVYDWTSKTAEMLEESPSTLLSQVQEEMKLPVASEPVKLKMEERQAAAEKKEDKTVAKEDEKKAQKQSQVKSADKGPEL